MPEKGDEPFSNPLPPPNRRISYEEMDASGSQTLTNEDFRKLLMTPRSAPKEAPPTAMARNKQPMPVEYEESDDKGALRRKKKSYYAKIKKEELERQAELAKKYRDRARERRDGVNKDYEETEMISTTANYKAVAPDVQSGDTAAIRRRQVIEESKYLGGDMEHTHLVKGLDYALLQKVRAEITTKEKEEDELEHVFKQKKDVEKEEDEKIQFRTKLGKSVFRTLFRSRQHERNELFWPGRMAYVVDLEDEYLESDIPTTLIRSKADLPNLESHTTLTTNDIVINKLTQILSYLRQGARTSKKLKKRDKAGKDKEERREKLTGGEENIFGDIGDYMPTVKPGSSREKGRDRDRDYKKTKSYFEKPKDEEHEDDRHGKSTKDFVKDIHDRFGKSKETDARLAAGWAPADLKLEQEAGKGNQKPSSKEDKDRGHGSGYRRDESRGKQGKRRDKDMFVPDSYAECYPGAIETEDATYDSDDEPDYSKMDLGNKKGPVGRWDFDTQEEYSDYMNNKEALPKAAFQFGVKMSEGRKTRRAGFGEKNEKAELNREWQKISNIIAKRKASELKGEHVKVPRY
ncbi:protein Red-like [Saccoglossus kowalevskii]|uniref:Protein Red-like n=1 Tax=Saccoglossus kowalevskii TaxID=10224 RepID=A0ABM0M3W2_SACKO|nr:PREDICTED: protein Red-like [Saccoglossus kowalevskii]